MSPAVPSAPSPLWRLHRPRAQLAHTGRIVWRPAGTQGLHGSAMHFASHGWAVAGVRAGSQGSNASAVRWAEAGGGRPRTGGQKARGTKHVGDATTLCIRAPDRGRSNTDTQNAGEGQGRAHQTRRRGTARQERQPEQREQGTRMEHMVERAHWRQRQLRGWPGQPAPSLPGARATPAQAASGGGVSPAAQMGCLRNRSGSPSGADQP